jgi:hypothetical protein
MAKRSHPPKSSESPIDAPAPTPPFEEQYLILIECDTEQQQLAMLRRLLAEGLKCRSLIA